MSSSERLRTIFEPYARHSAAGTGRFDPEYAEHQRPHAGVERNRDRGELKRELGPSTECSGSISGAAEISAMDNDGRRPRRRMRRS